jgi:rhamnosyltransferase
MKRLSGFERDMGARRATLTRVCGVVVTFNPKPDVSDNLERLRGQLEHVVVVDNGSRSEVLEQIRCWCNDLNIILIENGTNLGIATALNVGVGYAGSIGAEFTAFFDQDSTPDAGLMTALLETYANATSASPSGRPARVAIVSAKHVHEDTKTWMKPVLDPDGGPLVTITSGSLIPVSIFDHCGLFEDDLIIDRVDEEFCLRVRSMRYTIVQCEIGIVHVTLGAPRPFTLFGKNLFTPTHYSAGRRYYITRNRLVIVRRYWRAYPKWCSWALSGFFKELLFIVIAEESKLSKCANIIRGVRDAITGNMGMIVPL